ncbi:hypothetical protein HN51_053324 [Arachis hypogaea]
MGNVVEASFRQIDYIINYEAHVQELNQLVENFENNEQTVKRLVRVAKNNAEDILPAVEHRLDRVKAKIQENEVFRDSKTFFSKTRWEGLLPFFWYRRQLGRGAKILALEIQSLISEYGTSTNISIGRAPSFSESNLSHVGYIQFKSRNDIVREIIKQLKDPTVRMVGLHGPSGVGKTSLVKQIGQQAEFERVAMAIVKKDPDYQKVQQDIAHCLGLTFENNEGENGRTTRLRKVLKKENALVILDDLWDELDLNKIGIPLDDDDVASHVNVKDNSRKQGENEDSPGGTIKGCKVLVTSRHQEVLRHKMNVKEKLTFRVQELDVAETLKLFKKVVGMSIENPKFKPETLKKYCAGLPMAVIIVGKSLMCKNKSEWEGELERLKKNEVQKFMENHVKMRYDSIESEELKSTFLMCAQMGHQSIITDLVKYCYGLGILKDVYTLKDARTSITESIQKLRDFGLLDGHSNDNFSMHDIIRDTALSIACKNENVFILRNKILDIWPHKEQLERCTAIYLHKCHIVDGLPEVVNCPRLTFIHIDSDDSTLKIPDRFFEGMEELRVLVLSGIHLQSLPSSVKCLPNLRMLCLEKCTLGDLSILNHLRKLRILSLSGSRIEDWPTMLEGISKLQLLDISDCIMSNLTHPLSLSSFTSLEELYIRSSLPKMEVEGQTNQCQISILSELKHLHQLNTIDVCIPSAEFLPPDLFFHELNDYKIVIGDFKTISIGDFKMPNKYEASRSLALQLESGLDIHSLKGVKLLFKGVENLLLGELHGVENVFYELNLNGFPVLKHFSIVNNKDIEFIVKNSIELLSLPQDAFSNLEFLGLFNLKNIKEIICCSPTTNSSFSRLKTVKVNMCPQLKNIFFFTIVKFLTSLETIDISECDSLQAVIGEEDEKSNKVVLHKLCSLTLQNLPSFVSFYNKANMPLVSQFMEKQARIDDPGIVLAEDENEQSATTSFSLFHENVEIPNFGSLKLFSIKIHRIWSDQLSNDWFQNLIKLTLADCCNLTYLCSLSVARNLNELKSISISKCSLMEKLFIIEGNNNEHSKVGIFPKLEEIQLSQMEMLKDIWPRQDEVNADSFPRLISVGISECNKLDKIFPDHTKCWYLHLEILKVHRCESVEFIFESRSPPQQNDTKSASALLEIIDLHHLQYLKEVWNIDLEGAINFPNLQTIRISSCHQLRNVLPASITKDLGKLENFSISLCRNLEEIIAWDAGSETSNEPPLKFPEVISLSLSDLASIQCFYKGRHIVECPKLRQLRMEECPKLKIFTTESANEEGRVLLSTEKVTSKLEHLSIDSKGVEWLMSNTGKYRFTSLKQLYLTDWQSDNDETLYCFLHTIPNLQIFELGDDSNIREFVPSGNTAPKQRLGTVLLLKELTLWAPVMEDIGFERDPALQRSLHRLVLNFCNKLRRLAHSSVSFTHLTYLQVSYCAELKTLMTCSTAKSLVQLTTLKVYSCNKLNEIVTKDEQENEEGIKIVFAKLITIQLEGLSNLTSFCSNSNCEFSVPLLEKLTLTECPKMKTFTAKHTTAPKLQSVLARETYDEEEKGYWKGNLNATIQMLFADKVFRAPYTSSYN